MNSTIQHTTVTIVMGDLTGSQSRLVYRSTAPQQVEFNGSWQFARVRVAGQDYVGPVITPVGSSEPAVYLSASLPIGPLTPSDIWEPVQMPARVTATPVHTDLTAITVRDGQVRGHWQMVWLPRQYAPLQQFLLPISDPMAAATVTQCVVLDADRYELDWGLCTSLVVLLADGKIDLSGWGWHRQEWLTELDGLWADRASLTTSLGRASR